MKKSIIFSVLAAGILLFQTVSVSATPGPHGHRSYSKHQKHHKMHKMHKPHGMIDATYR
ncbi:MAG: hypothetical protein JWM14_1539 [Chitinophagaceae bacterium]|nr:hypothetical protein [Chitinophagaceae bacterium]